MVKIEGRKKYKSYKLTFISATDTKPKRIRILDELIGNRVFIPYAYDKDFVSASISYLFCKHNIVIKAIVHKGDEVYLLSDDFSKSL